MTEEAKKPETAVETRQNTAPAKAQMTPLQAMLNHPNAMQRIKDAVGDRAPQFISSILSLVNSSAMLKEATPQSVIASAMIAASLDLPVNQNLGFAHIVAYSGVAQLQIGYKGFVQLAQRTGLYKLLNACPICEGELVSYSKLTGEIVIDESKRTSDNVIGYAAYMKLLSGYERTEYWPLEKVKAHSARFSQAVKKGKKDSPWFTNFDSMALKTVVKALLSHWGPMTTQMQRAVEEDQASHRGLDAPAEYLDNVTETTAPKRAQIAAPVAMDALPDDLPNGDAPPADPARDALLEKLLAVQKSTPLKIERAMAAADVDAKTITTDLTTDQLKAIDAEL